MNYLISKYFRNPPLSHTPRPSPTFLLISSSYSFAYIYIHTWRLSASINTYTQTPLLLLPEELKLTMALSLSNAKLLLHLATTPLADALSHLAIRRRVIGYAVGAASRGGEAAGGGKQGSTSTHQVEENAVIHEHSGSTTTSTAWGPDPVTGYYRPDDRAAAIDTAELRDVALNHKEITKQQN
ncbi:uncharacterized protein LOC131317663 [Rhododendron vialii]|uniref:uncharacterized protein LOC131317663 n=1 Tax=Rhododendron vialii TaxID=182163 RepID=UPI00265E4863|nr:uncharacterized protein LOC131317663 [Rhododendron vialii]